VGNEINVAVRDDGKGFEADAPVPGFGITGMRGRIAPAGGRLEISSSPVAGTSVRAVLRTTQLIRQIA
jgi:signal transduction histidine kinase